MTLRLPPGLLGRRGGSQEWTRARRIPIDASAGLDAANSAWRRRGVGSFPWFSGSQPIHTARPSTRTSAQTGVSARGETLALHYRTPSYRGDFPWHFELSESRPS